MTRDEILQNARRVERDLAAMQRARECLYTRMRELEHDDPEYFIEFTDWAGIQALMNVFVLNITRCQGLLEDYQRLLDQCEPAQVVKLVKEES